MIKCPLNVQLLATKLKLDLFLQLLFKPKYCVKKLEKNIGKSLLGCTVSENLVTYEQCLIDIG